MGGRLNRGRMLSGADILVGADRVEYDRLMTAAAESRAAGHRLDAWAYEGCARDLVERARGIRRCSECGRVKR